MKWSLKNMDLHNQSTQQEVEGAKDEEKMSKGGSRGEKTWEEEDNQKWEWGGTKINIRSIFYPCPNIVWHFPTDIMHVLGQSVLRYDIPLVTISSHLMWTLCPKICVHLCFLSATKTRLRVWLTQHFKRHYAQGFIMNGASILDGMTLCSTLYEHMRWICGKPR